MAYICKSTEVLDFFTGGNLPPAAAAPAFVGALGGLMYLGGNTTLDKVNQVKCVAACGCWQCLWGLRAFVDIQPRNLLWFACRLL